MKRDGLMQSHPRAEELLELIPARGGELISLGMHPERPPGDDPNHAHIVSTKWTKWVLKITHRIRGFSSDG